MGSDYNWKYQEIIWDHITTGNIKKLYGIILQLEISRNYMGSYYNWSMQITCKIRIDKYQ